MAGLPSRSRGAALAAAFVCVLALQSCGANSYAGIPLESGAADPELQDLARRARAGDKHAQLELGIRFEEGRGVRRDLDQARRSYREASRSAGGTRLAYIPANGRNSRSMTVPISSGRLTRGLPEAAQRLARLEARGASPESSQRQRADAQADGVDAAFRDLVLLDHFFARCSVSPARQPARAERFAATRACVASQRPPRFCDDVRTSIRKVSVLTIETDAFAVLAPAAYRALRHCRGTAAASGASDPAALSPVELIGASRERRLEQIDTPAATYLQELCVAVLTGTLPDVRTSEILICSEGAVEGGAVERSRQGLRAILNGSH